MYVAEKGGVIKVFDVATNEFKGNFIDLSPQVNDIQDRGLLDIAGWQSMALTVAAQKVQISAYPDHYAKWETSARAWFAALA